MWQVGHYQAQSPSYPFTRTGNYWLAVTKEMRIHTVRCTSCQLYHKRMHTTHLFAIADVNSVATQFTVFSSLCTHSAQNMSQNRSRHQQSKILRKFLRSIARRQARCGQSEKAQMTPQSTKTCIVCFLPSFTKCTQAMPSHSTTLCQVTDIKNLVTRHK